MGVKPSSNEEEYFAKLNEEKKKKLREKNRHEAMEGGAEAIQSELDTSEQVAEELLELGFCEDSARLLPLVPLVQLAWADDVIEEREQELILSEAQSHGFEEGSEALDYLREMLNERPEEEYFERVRDLLDAMIDDYDAFERADVMTLAEDLANSSDEWFGMFAGIDEDEREMLARLQHDLVN